MMKTYPILLNNDAGGQGGGGGGTPDQGQQRSAGQQIFSGGDGTASGEEESGGASAGASSQGQQGGGGEEGHASAAPGTISLDVLKQLAQELRGSPAQTQQQQDAPRMSQEEFDQMFHVVKPTAEQWQAIRGEDSQAAVSALTDLLHGAVRQAATLSGYHMMQRLNELQTQMAPAMKLAEQQELNALKEEFFQSYPDLKGLEPLLLQIRDSFIVQKRQFANKEDAFKAVAEEAQKLLEKIPGLRGGQQQAGGPNGRQQQQTGRRMPTLSGKGQGGGQGAASGTMNTAKRIFGPS